MKSAFARWLPVAANTEAQQSGKQATMH